jgi:hypothetical protein
MHQQPEYAVHSSFPLGRVKNARGRYSEVCTGVRSMAMGPRTDVRLAESVPAAARSLRSGRTYEAFLFLGCALICWRFLSRLGGGSKVALPVIH